MVVLVHVCFSLVSPPNTSYVMGIPTPLVAATSIMSFWVSTDQVNPAVWISIFLVFPIIFNMFNVRRYGEIEFWLTSIKTTTCVGIIILGILIPMGASTATPLWGTNSQHELVPCDLTVVPNNCTGQPGFYCSNLLFLSDS
jgi:amino acid permease